MVSGLDNCGRHDTALFISVESVVHSLLPSNLKSWTQAVAAHLGVRAGKRLGQHFLIDKKVLHSIVEAAGPIREKPVLEIGGGLGVLTLALMEAGARVVVVELDRVLAQGLQSLARGSDQLMVVTGDISAVSDNELRTALNNSNATFTIVANLPYEISGAFLRRFLGGEFLPDRMVLLLQREVAERLVAKPGDMSLLSVLAELSCSEREIVETVKAKAFWPQPKVESAIVRLVVRSAAERRSLFNGVPEAALWQVAKLGFSARRKQLLSNLAKHLDARRIQLEPIFFQLGLSATSRAQELSFEQWLGIVQALLQVGILKES